MAEGDNWYDVRVYVANLGKYNEGTLMGAWATLPMERDELDAFLRDEVGIDTDPAMVQAKLARGGRPYEEYQIADCDMPFWMPKGLVDENTNLEDLNVMAGVMSTLSGGMDDARKAQVWADDNMISDMSARGAASSLPLVFANYALQADDIPFHEYEAGTREDLHVSSNEEAFAWSVAETDPELREALDGRFGTFIDMEAVGRDYSLDCVLYDDGYLDKAEDEGVDPTMYSRGELTCLAGLDDGDGMCAAADLADDMGKGLAR